MLSVTLTSRTRSVRPLLGSNSRSAAKTASRHPDLPLICSLGRILLAFQRRALLTCFFSGHRDLLPFAVNVDDRSVVAQLRRAQIHICSSWSGFFDTVLQREQFRYPSKRLVLAP